MCIAKLEEVDYMHALDMFSIFERVFWVREDCCKILQFVWP